VQKLVEVFVYLKNETWRKKMHQTKLLKLLGISLIVGILGLTGFCKKSNNNNDLALGAGLVVAQQQAEQAAYEAAYQAANSTENPQWFCAWVTKNPSNNYSATLMPLVAQDCNTNFVGSLFDKQKLLDTINSDTNLNTSCPQTKNVISNFTPPSFGGGSTSIKFIFVNGRGIL
jgi:hypothetical protein